MRTIRDYQFIADEDRGAVAAIGNFDGVHLGHQAALNLVRKIAKRVVHKLAHSHLNLIHVNILHLNLKHSV